ncbi:MAG: PorT family protein [Bacteroidia bacterium]|nr:PorT family protein [Bacteroidia bacterium]
MKFNLAVFLIICPLFLFGQSNSSLDVSIKGFRSYRNLAPLDSDPITTAIISNRDAEEPILGYGFGLHFNQRLFSNLFLRVGFGYSSIGYKFFQEDVLFPDRIDSSGTITPSNESIDVTLVSKYNLLELPLALRFEIGKGKVRPFAEAGVIPMIYLSTRKKQISDEETLNSSSTSTDSFVNSIHLMGKVSVGVHADLTESLSLFIQPYLRGQFNALTEGSVRESLQDYGLEIGIRKNL